MPYLQFQTSRVSEAYSVLELEELSLCTHPDKNPDNPTATQQFQKISEAYRILLKHLSDDDDSDESNYGDDYDDEYMFELYRRVFEMFMRDEEHAFYACAHRSKPLREEETPQQYQARIQRSLDEQKAGEERRQREKVELKAKKEKERERERAETEERQRMKNSSKKASAKTRRQKDIDTMRDRQEASQRTRSAVFAAARKGDAKRVEQGIWEEHVDAAGGEVKEGCQDFVQVAPKDPHETLLHIAARKGDHGLVKWLDSHGAELEEKNAVGLTAFHVALQRGQLSVATYFFDEHSPSADTAKMYNTPPSTSLLSLAVESLEPELVWMVLDKNLASKQDMNSVLERFSNEGPSLKEKIPSKVENIHDIEQLLARYVRFTPQTPVPRKEPRHSHPESKHNIHVKTEHVLQTRISTPEQYTPQIRGRGRGRGRGRRQGQGQGSVLSSVAIR